MNTRHTFWGAADQREDGWSAGSGKSEVDRWRLEVGCQLLEVGCWLMEGDCYLLDVVASNTVSVIHTATSAVRLLLSYQRTTPWKASGAGVAEQKTHSWSVKTQYKISSLVTAVSIIVIGGGRRTKKQLIGYAPVSWFSGRGRHSEGRAYWSTLHRRKRWFAATIAPPRLSVWPRTDFSTTLK